MVSNLIFRGLQEMTDAEIKYTFGQRAKTRIMNGSLGVGTYLIKSATQGGRLILAHGLQKVPQLILKTLQQTQTIHKISLVILQLTLHKTLLVILLVTLKQHLQVILQVILQVTLLITLHVIQLRILLVTQLLIVQQILLVTFRHHLLVILLVHLETIIQ